MTIRDLIEKDISIGFNGKHVYIKVKGNTQCNLSLTNSKYEYLDNLYSAIIKNWELYWYDKLGGLNNTSYVVKHIYFKDFKLAEEIINEIRIRNKKGIQF